MTVIVNHPGAHRVSPFMQNLRYAFRRLVTEPGFALVVVLAIGLGIGMNTTVFTLVNAAVLRPLPFKDAERIVRLGVRNVDNAQTPISGLSHLDLQDWRTAHATFEDIGASEERGVDVSGDERPATRVSAAYVSWNVFSLIGQPVALGRDFIEVARR